MHSHRSVYRLNHSVGRRDEKPPSHCLSYCLPCLCALLWPENAASDNGDGTFTNPVIAADFPDPDVILVDST